MTLAGGNVEQGVIPAFLSLSPENPASLSLFLTLVREVSFASLMKEFTFGGPGGCFSHSAKIQVVSKIGVSVRKTKQEALPEFSFTLAMLSCSSI